MSVVKQIQVKSIHYSLANAFIKKHHYSGKIVPNSQLHFGCYLNERLLGVMQFGPSMDKSKIQGLVSNTGWNEFIELNRMAFADELPKNSESRCIAIALRLIKKNAPHIKWVISFADGTQCGDGTIYRASGFFLTDIRTNKNTARLPNGVVIHKMTLESNPTSPRQELFGKTYYDITGGRFRFSDYIKYTKSKVLIGYQLRYIYFIDKSKQKDLTVPILPFSKIADMGAKMYKGKRVELESKALGFQPKESRAVLTNTHQRGII